jgi:putative ABC transport system ATP-binding protein
MTDIIRLNNVVKTYYDVKQQRINILENINLTIKKSQKLAIVGRSGSGKSTLLNVIAMLDDFGSGAIEYNLNGKQYVNNGSTLRHGPKQSFIINPGNIRSNFGFVFQTPFTLGNFSVEANLELPLIIKEIPIKKRKVCVDKMLEKIDLLERRLFTTDKLSGGQRQRVAVGRSIINMPAVIFADEPTGNLDVHTANVIMELFLSNEDNKNWNPTLILVTHDPHIACRFSDRVIGIRSGSIKFDKITDDICVDDIISFIKETNEWY